MRRLHDAPPGCRPSILNNIVNREMRMHRRIAANATPFAPYFPPKRREVVSAVRSDWLRAYGVAL